MVDGDQLIMKFPLPKMTIAVPFPLSRRRAEVIRKSMAAVAEIIALLADDDIDLSKISGEGVFHVFGEEQEFALADAQEGEVESQGSQGAVAAGSSDEATEEAMPPASVPGEE